MTATYNNATFTKDGITIKVHVTPDYKENYTRGNLKKIPSPITSQDRSSPGDADYGRQDKPQIIDLGLAPERRLTINGYIINSSDDGDTFNGTALTSAMDKKNALTLMFMSGGNATFTMETGSIIFTPFQNVYVDKFEFAKVPNDALGSSGVSSLPDGVVEYSFIISMEDSAEYGT